MIAVLAAEANLRKIAVILAVVAVVSLMGPSILVSAVYVYGGLAVGVALGWVILVLPNRLRAA